MAKKKIKTTPASTGDQPKKKKPGKGKPNKKPAPAPDQQPVADKTQLPKWDAYQRAIAQGQERRFLKKNKGFRQRAGIPMPARTGTRRLNSDDAKTSSLFSLLVPVD